MGYDDTSQCATFKDPHRELTKDAISVILGAAHGIYSRELLEP